MELLLYRYHKGRVAIPVPAGLVDSEQTRRSSPQLMVLMTRFMINPEGLPVAGRRVPP